MNYLTASVPPAEGLALSMQPMSNFSAIWVKWKCEACVLNKWLLVSMFGLVLTM